MDTEQKATGILEMENEREETYKRCMGIVETKDLLRQWSSVSILFCEWDSQLKFLVAQLIG